MARVQTTDAGSKATYMKEPEEHDKAVSIANNYSFGDDFFSDEYCDDISYNSSDRSVEMEDVQNDISFFHKSVSSPALIAMNAPLQAPLVDKEVLRRHNMMSFDSSPALQSNQGMPASLMERMMKAELVIGETNSKIAAAPAPLKVVAQPSPQEAVRNPQELFSVFLENKGIKADVISALELNGFFLQMTAKNFSGYDMTKFEAIRTEDIEGLRRMLREGQTLQVCNRFGESVVHTACRRSLARVLQFLVQEAKVSVKVVDDSGRTPMHDACWSHRPNFDSVKILISACPDLLLLADRRGFTPLQYVGKDLWGEWCRFLEDNIHNLMPRELVRPLR
jgi:hypothetical protein